MGYPDQFIKHKYLIALMQYPKFGYKRLAKIMDIFPDMESAWLASPGSFIKAGIEEKILNEFFTFKKNIDPDQIIEKLAVEKINVVALGDNHYPKLLKEIGDPPPLLYFKGDITENGGHSLSIVGARNNSTYGDMAVKKIVGELVKSGFSITSGLALGIDALAHAYTLKEGGRTVAIIGSGIDRKSVYPRENLRLADEIIEKGGALISEFPLLTPPLKQHFPQRNRLIAGYSLGTLVIEANERSGSLITARFALDYGREVMAVPGSIFSALSRGTAKLIKDGAIPITSAEEIREALDITPLPVTAASPKPKDLSPLEDDIFTNLRLEPLHINELIRQTGLDTPKIMSTLTIMEIKGLVRNIGGMEYIKL